MGRPVRSWSPLGDGTPRRDSPTGFSERTPRRDSPPLGPLKGRPWGRLGPSWADLGTSWADRGPHLDRNCDRTCDRNCDQTVRPGLPRKQIHCPILLRKRGWPVTRREASSIRPPLPSGRGKAVLDDKELVLTRDTSCPRQARHSADPGDSGILVGFKPHKNLAFPRVLATFRYLRSSDRYLRPSLATPPPSSPNAGATSAQDGPKTDQEAPKWLPRKPQGGPQTGLTRPKTMQFTRVLATFRFLRHLGSIFDSLAATFAQLCPKVAPRRPKIASRRP